MKNIIVTIVILFAVCAAQAQQQTTTGSWPHPAGTGKDEPGVDNFNNIEEMPEFPGGLSALQDFMSSNITMPKAARKAKLRGKVIVQFAVDTDGSISDIVVIRDIGNGCGNEVARMVKSMPKWKPGKQNGVLVKVPFTLPVNFN